LLGEKNVRYSLQLLANYESYDMKQVTIVKKLELFTNLVFSVGIGWYFLGILPTETEGKLGWYILQKNGGSPRLLPSKKGGCGPLSEHTQPPF
jgi:hypothetical protein